MARVYTQAAATALGLPGRRSLEIASAAKGTENVTLRLVEIPVPAAGERPRPQHWHQGFEEVIHVLAGCGCTEADSGSHPLAAGDTIVIAPGEKHATRNTGSEPLVLLCFFPVGDVAHATREDGA
jgi:quercetin dioxygenase-like cupin family protein